MREPEFLEPTTETDMDEKRETPAAQPEGLEVTAPEYDAPFLPNTPAQNLPWQRIMDHRARNRVYIYEGGKTLKVPDVEWVAVKVAENGTHSHRLRTLDGACVYVPAGWIALQWDGYFQF